MALDVFLDIVYALLAVLNVWMVFSFIYYFVISFWGYGPAAHSPEYAPQTRFLVFVPACNEEKVIQDVVESVRNAQYPSELVTLCVIADNCTDRTADIARAMGVMVVETKTRPGEPIGKPHAIKKVLDQHPEYYADYDLLTVFDADNLISANFCAEINNQDIHEERPAAIQAYLGCKNKRGLVAFFYYHSYTLTNRFFQLSKCRQRINCAIGGTGMAISLPVLHRLGGWQANSLTEDMELQLMLTSQGERILWNHHARIYDEKPVSPAIAFKQRTRWSQGHWFVSLRNAMPLVKACKQKRISFKELISSYCYMFSMPMSIQIPLLMLAALITMALEQFHPMTFLGLAHMNWLYTGLMSLPFLYTLFALFFIADWSDNQEKPSFRSGAKIVVSYLALYPLCLASQVLGFFKHRDQRVWAKTSHSIDANQSDNLAPQNEVTDQKG